MYTNCTMKLNISLQSLLSNCIFQRLHSITHWYRKSNTNDNNISSTKHSSDITSNPSACLKTWQTMKSRLKTERLKRKKFSAPVFVHHSV